MTTTTASPTSEPSRRVVMERTLRRRSLPWVLRARRLDRRPRRDPDFIVAGAQKAASTSLFAYLAAHPDVDQPLVKEIHYFDMLADKGHAWYQRHFPLQAETTHITGEASPLYMVHPLAMERMAMELPQVKVIAVLRHPVDRLVSHYRHSVKLGHEHLSLLEALAAEDERVDPEIERLEADPFFRARAFMKYTYLRRSLYHDQVTRIQALFPDRHLFLRLEDLTTPESLAPLCVFLGIRFDPSVHFEAHNVNRTVEIPGGQPLPPALVERLRADAARTTALLGWPAWDL